MKKELEEQTGELIDPVRRVGRQGVLSIAKAGKTRTFLKGN